MHTVSVCACLWMWVCMCRPEVFDCLPPNFFETGSLTKAGAHQFSWTVWTVNSGDPPALAFLVLRLWVHALCSFVLKLWVLGFRLWFSYLHNKHFTHGTPPGPLIHSLTSVSPSFWSFVYSFSNSLFNAWQLPVWGSPGVVRKTVKSSSVPCQLWCGPIWLGLLPIMVHRGLTSKGCCAVPVFPNHRHLKRSEFLLFITCHQENITLHTVSTLITLKDQYVEKKKARVD